MKIYTITCHNVYNHGASLQAYALLTYLEQLGHEVEIIDYKPDYLCRNFKLLSVNSPKWEKNLFTKCIYISAKLPERIVSLKKKEAFDRFTRGYLKLTPVEYDCNENLCNNLPAADVYICGSDQIWNCVFPNGKDPSFYLDFAPDDKLKISYAASFGIDSIPGKHKKVLKERIGRLNYISVREDNAIRILNNLEIHRGVHVLDPVFLLCKDNWEKLCTGIFKERYLLVYNFDNDEIISKIAQDMAKKLDCRIYSLDKTKYSDKCFNYSSPEEFLGLVRNAAYIVTNSFHATAFSIIFQKNFLVVGREEKLNSRMTSLLKSVGLLQRYVSGKFNITEALKSIDYMKVNVKLNLLVQNSKRFIYSALYKNIPESVNDEKHTFCT